jgi:hypothetical protein
MIHVQNPKATIGKYRYLTLGDWQAIVNQITPTRGKAVITDSKNGREVSFTRAEVEFITAKYGTVRA